MNEQGITSSEEDQQFYPHHNNGQEVQIEPDDKAERIILEEIQQVEKKQGKNSVLSEDIEFKLQQVIEDIQDDDHKHFQTIITLRMKELAYNKILVLTYEKSYFRLVRALYHIAKEYIRFECYEQALCHLENAIAKNVKATSNSINKFYHSFILTAVAQCKIKIKKYQEALSELTQAISLQEEYQLIDRKAFNNIKTLTLLAKVKDILKHPDSLQKIAAAVDKAKKLKGQRSRAYGLVLYEQGTFLKNHQKNQDAIRYYENAIEAIKLSNWPEFEEDIIKIYHELAEMYQKNNKIDQYISTLRSRYQVFEDTYGNSDKKSIKQQRTLATALLKYKHIDQSLEQFDDILEKEQKVYGENSLQVGKQYKTIGNIYAAKNDTKTAENIFKKALKIFHDLGDQRLAREIRMKISSLQIHQN